ncbi:MgtC/SapB family protein [Paenibacillus alvei]|uniref:MgtC/SapB family protein n=1 Tax=Paenibacillus alvei TaxID=44250 RepID=UPI0013D9DA8D|nr:MgtC/SapB family protein [Paenibacillus alvei]NEZ44640.1 MgtC/SapB family protein [Paenibacillus alvei]
MGPSDISMYHVMLRMVLALVLGGCIGLEREKRSQAAGLRTHMLVSLGSALVMLISVYGFPDLSGDNKAAVDVARIAAQVVSGVGFLGAGTIIRNGTSVKGLTTAASLWVSAAIGLACGSGFISAALFGCGLSLVALWVLNKYDIKNRVAHRIHELEVVVKEREGWLTALTKVAEEQGLTVRSIRMRPERAGKTWAKFLGAGQGQVFEQNKRSEHLPERDIEVYSTEKQSLEGTGHKEAPANSTVTDKAVNRIGEGLSLHMENEVQSDTTMDDNGQISSSTRYLHIELKVLAEEVKSVTDCCEVVLRLEGVMDVHMIS